MASSGEDFWLKLLFKLKLYEVSGDGFQMLFNRLMELSNPSFQAISPWGDWGDGGNDGWIEQDGHYFQVYGPKATSKNENSAVSALNKAIEDFDKLPKKWAEVKRYTFVFNDRYCGIPAPLASAMQKLRIDKSLEKTGVIGCNELTNIFMSLEEAFRQEIIPGIPSGQPDYVDPRCVGDLLSNLADSANARFNYLSIQAPDFEEKISLNGLAPCIAEALKYHFWHVSTVDDFLNARGPGLQQAIAKEVNDLYVASKEAILDDDMEAPSIRYAWMLDRLIPSTARTHPHTLKAYQTAAQIVLSKYFETCDVYEHPVSVNSAQAYALQ